MPSLKTHMPQIARILGVTVAQLYERQRLLTKERIVNRRRGHGPGSGVEATPASLATLLIAIMGSEKLSDTVDSVFEIANTSPTGGSCGITRRGRFKDALAAVLATSEFARVVDRIELSRTARSATIVTSGGMVSSFTGAHRPKAGMQLAASLGPAEILALHSIAKAMAVASEKRWFAPPLEL